jgi:two-component system chemotaxis response regulator CheY
MKSCLIVDDSRVVRQLARGLLEELKFQVDEAENGKTALETCKKQMPDVILLDWNMPVMDGFNFLHKLRATEGGEKPVVVFCTTQDEIVHVRDALKAGANEYIIKPFDIDILQSTLKQARVM